MLDEDKHNSTNRKNYDLNKQKKNKKHNKIALDFEIFKPIIPYSNSNEYLFSDEFVPHFRNDGMVKSTDNIKELYINYQHQNHDFSRNEAVNQNKISNIGYTNDSFGSHPVMHQWIPNESYVDPRPKLIQKKK